MMMMTTRENEEEEEKKKKRKIEVCAVVREESFLKKKKPVCVLDPPHPFVRVRRARRQRLRQSARSALLIPRRELERM